MSGFLSGLCLSFPGFLKSRLSSGADLNGVLSGHLVQLLPAMEPVSGTELTILCPKWTLLQGLEQDWQPRHSALCCG
jgi:hypothetical protein